MLAALLLLSVAQSGPTLGPPRLPAGTERLFTGAAEEVSRDVTNPFRKRHELEVRLLVLASHPGGADCAVLTRVWPLADPVISGPTAALTGRGVKDRGEPSVRLDLLRVDPRGRVWQLATAPFAVGPGATASPLPEPPTDRLPAVESGFFVPLPPRPVRAGDQWDGDAGERWAVGGEVEWNGAVGVVVTAVRQTADYDRPAAAVTGWRRTDTLTVLPADGVAVAVGRQVDRREGGAVVGELRVSYTRQAAGRQVGSWLAAATREVEAACRFQAELAPLVAQGPRADQRQVRQRLAKVQRHLEERPANVPFREAVEAVRASGEALLR